MYSLFLTAFSIVVVPAAALTHVAPLSVEYSKSAVVPLRTILFVFLSALAVTFSGVAGLITAVEWLIVIELAGRLSSPTIS